MGYIRKDIVLDFKVPTVLENFFIEVEAADERNDGSYEGYADHVDVICKCIYMEGGLTKKQWDKIIEKYPYPYE